jgi:hypothetical protein
MIRAAKIKLLAVSLFLSKYKEPYTRRVKSVEFFEANFLKMHEQIIAGCKKAVKKVIIYCWNKDLDTNLIRDNTYLENYDTEFEDDKAVNAVDIV